MILLDGAMGTELERLMELPHPAWSSEALRINPDAVRAVHAAYAEAGATVHTTATFRTAERPDLTQRAVQLCREAVPTHHLVAGSMAPVEDCYRPDLSPMNSERHHRGAANHLVESGVDILLVETFAHPNEALIATRAAVATGTTTWTSLTPGFDGTLLSPDRLRDTAAALYDAGAERVLVNCLPATSAMRWLTPLASLQRSWGVYANGRTDDGLVSPERYAELSRRWADQGASVIGGCCYTRPAHIRHLHREHVDLCGK